jgi:hypothetical protein
VLQDFLNDFRVSDFGNDTQFTAAHWAYGNINIKYTFEFILDLAICPDCESLQANGRSGDISA